ETLSSAHLERRRLASGDGFEVLSLHPCDGCCPPGHDRTKTRRHRQHHWNGRKAGITDAYVRRSRERGIDAGYPRLGNRAWKVWDSCEWDQSGKHVHRAAPGIAEG